MFHTVKIVIQYRYFLLPTVIIVCLLITPVIAAAHEGKDESDHSTHYELELSPGESKTYQQYKRTDG